MTAVFPGSFNPPHFGHLDIIKRACIIFGGVTVAILKNSGKTSVFTPAERLDILNKMTVDLDNVHIILYDGLLVDLAANYGVVVRGVRTADFEYENKMAQINSLLNPKIEYVFLPAKRELEYVSSSAVRELAAFGRAANGFAPEFVTDILIKRLSDGGN